MSAPCVAACYLCYLYYIVMRQYHIAYTLFIESMTEFRKNMELLERAHIQDNMLVRKIDDILHKTSDSLEIAEREVFLPCGELLNITEALQGISDDMKISMQEKDCLKKSFSCLDKAAESMMHIADDVNLQKVKSITGIQL